MLVTLEGIDGSGKTTVWEALQAEYPEATFTREPTDSWYGEAVYRSIEDDDADPLAELFLYTADHADHLTRVIEPALERGDIVISDRYADSRYAYQGATLDGEVVRPMEYVRGIHTAFTIEPDLTLYFDVDPETGASRAGVTNKFERVSFLSHVHENYDRLRQAEPERFVTIDASQPPEDVIDRVIEIMDEVHRSMSDST
ncbi:dTMP kinase [Halovivax gelatinilyticus]|uniref:dTMP kinase n=1 Tax=Halovivax gelatinilyticus TaxID=2961597 RepID=UPI0020CA7B9A|nr:dTMP kinase [Halovivax gelatinilyticus]